MVDHIRATERVGAVLTPTRPRKVKRDPNRRDQRRQEPEEEKDGRDRQGRNAAPATAQGDAEEAPDRAESKSTNRGQRINVVI